MIYIVVASLVNKQCFILQQFLNYNSFESSYSNMTNKLGMILRNNKYIKVKIVTG